jgi:hypothetical protein
MEQQPGYRLALAVKFAVKIFGGAGRMRKSGPRNWQKLVSHQPPRAAQNRQLSPVHLDFPGEAWQNWVWL